MLRHLVDQAEALFLDFDGPVCSVFAGLSASVVVDQLCVVLADAGYGDPPPEIEKSSDPFDVLRYAASIGEAEARYVNAAFTAHEVEAIASAEPTAGVYDLMRAWSKAGRPLAIVSNNSALAVEGYLDLRKLRRYVTYVSARTSPDPSLLKPNPYLLVNAMKVLEVAPRNVVFVGDSVADIEAANAVGVKVIAYVNKPSKRQTLSNAGPTAMTARISDLTRSAG